MTAGEYLRGLRRAAHIPVPQMAIAFGQPVMVVWEIESNRRTIPSAWVPLLALAYKADFGRLSELVGA